MFDKRSFQKELLDADDIPSSDLYQNLRELNFINIWLGGHDITLAGIKKFESVLQNSTIADVGCGGGDNLKAVAIWARKNKISVKLIGIDIKADCILFAQENCKTFPEISFIQSDYRLIDQKFDVIFSALFCHHLNDVQMLEYLTWCEQNSNKGYFVNDLQRHFMAHYSIKWLTMLFSNSYLVKNDAPLSVLRGFSASEWRLLTEKAQIQDININWKWTFRHLVWKIKPL
jgi:cyclopropane fatty-acyl-phospholipid synthase-like methyltransferase